MRSRVLIFVVLAGLVVSCAGSWPPRRWGKWGASCPAGSREVLSGVEHYCIVTCAGALQDRVWSTGMWGVGVFDRAKVFALQRHDDHGIVADAPTAPPEEVCRALPHGCVCTEQPCTRLSTPTLLDVDALRDAPGPSPRCLASDPDCGPEAFSHECIGQAGYRADRARRPVAATRSAWDRARMRNPCTFDGECLDSGCGYQCGSVRSPTAGDAFICIGLPEADRRLADAFCGCVEGACAWFKQ